MNRKKALAWLVQLSLLGASGVLLFSWVSFDQLISALLSADLSFVSLICGLIVLAALVRGCNLVYLVRRNLGQISFRSSIRLQLVSYFLNSFVFLNLGGDVALFFLLRRNVVSDASRVNLLIVDRATGVAGAFACLVAFAIFSPNYVVAAAALAFELLDSCEISNAVWALVAVAVLAVTVVGVATLARGRYTVAAVAYLHKACDAWARHKARWLWTFAGSTVISMALQLTKVALLWSATRAIGLDVHLGLLGVTASLAALVSMLPVTAGGLGIAELTVVAAFAIDGVSSGSALSAAILARLYWLILGIWGWAFMGRTTLDSIRMFRNQGRRSGRQDLK